MFPSHCIPYPCIPAFLQKRIVNCNRYRVNRHEAKIGAAHDCIRMPLFGAGCQTLVSAAKTTSMTEVFLLSNGRFAASNRAVPCFRRQILLDTDGSGPKEWSREPGPERCAGCRRKSRLSDRRIPPWRSPLPTYTGHSICNRLQVTVTSLLTITSCARGAALMFGLAHLNRNFQMNRTKRPMGITKSCTKVYWFFIVTECI